MKSYNDLLIANKEWAKQQVKAEPNFFKELSGLQTPQFLWIGCSDSRVPANEITNTKPGEIFVHRNVANLVVHTDLNLMTVLMYAVDVLKVKHVIVCGHYGCGGVQAAMTNKSFGLINRWLTNIKDVYRFHREEVDALKTLEERENLMVELNVREQVLNLAKTSLIQEAWTKEGRPTLHGCVYGLKDGILKDLVYMDSKTAIDPIYKYDLDK